MRSHMTKKALEGSTGEVSEPTVLYCDNFNNIQLVKNPVFHTRTKHSEVHYHFVHERVLSSEVELVYVPTDRQTADIFTKPLSLDKLRHLSSVLNLQHLDIVNLKGRSGRDEVRNPNRMRSSVSGRLKKRKTDAKGATKGTSRRWSQPNKGETKPKKARQAAESRRAESRRLGRGQTWLRALKKTN